MLVTAAFGTANTGADVRYQVLNADRTVHVARTATGVTELIAGSGTYGVQLAPSVIYGRTVVFDIQGTSRTAAASYYAPADFLAAISDPRIANLDAPISTRSTLTAPQVWTHSDRAITDKAGFSGEATNLAAIATAVWAHSIRSLSTFGTLVADIWSAAVRSLTDKVGFSGVATNMVSEPPTAAAITSAVWGATTRTLSTIADSAGITTLLSRLTALRADKLDRNLAERADVAITVNPTTLATAERTAIASSVWTAPIRDLTQQVISDRAELNIVGFDQITTLLQNAGSGSVVYPYSVRNSRTEEAIPNVKVVVTLDEAGEHKVAGPGYTNNEGVVRFLLNPGTHYFWCQKPSFSFENPDREEVVISG